jgi:hypothetical protein
MRVTYRGYSRNHGTKLAAEVDLLAKARSGEAGVVVKGAGSKVECSVWGLLGSPDGHTLHRYFLTMSVPELAAIVREVMAKAPSAELLEAVATGALAALPRRSRKPAK